MTTTRVYNTSPLRQQLDTAGHGIDPATWRDANPADPVTAALLASGALIAAQPAPPPEAAPVPDPEPDPAPAGKPGRKKETN